MGDISVRLSNSRTLWLMELSRYTIEDQRLPDIEGDGGLFVVLEDESDDRFDVLAKAASFNAGVALLDLFNAILGPATEAA